MVYFGLTWGVFGSAGMGWDQLFSPRDGEDAVLRGLGRSLSHALVDMRLELGEVVDEQLDELLRGAVVVVLVGPGGARVEDGAVHARDSDRNVEAEVRVLAELGRVQASVERGVEQGSRRLDRHALAYAVLAAGPAGVEQPALHLTLGDPYLEQVAVDARVARHERGAEAGAEGRLGLGHADLGAGDFGGVAGEEMV